MPGPDDFGGRAANGNDCREAWSLTRFRDDHNRKTAFYHLWFFARVVAPQRFPDVWMILNPHVYDVTRMSLTPKHPNLNRCTGATLHLLGSMRAAPPSPAGFARIHSSVLQGLGKMLAPDALGTCQVRDAA